MKRRNFLAAGLGALAGIALRPSLPAVAALSFTPPSLRYGWLQNVDLTGQKFALIDGATVGNCSFEDCDIWAEGPVHWLGNCTVKHCRFWGWAERLY